MLPGMDDDYPALIADFLETTAAKIRSLTVDRVRNATTWTAVGIVLAVLAIVLVTFLVVGIFRIVGELITVELAYVAFGGLFVIIGALVWSRRLPRQQGSAAARKDTNG
jgi:drug/metabolite transporter superfamily protein YnfA